MRLALAQLNVIVGDLDGNVRADHRRDRGSAHGIGADLVVLPELAVTGYPPEDLLLRPGFVRAAREAVDEIAARDRGHRRARRPARCSTAISPTRAPCCARRRLLGRLPQALPAELRRLRRAPLLRRGPRPGAAAARRRADRPDDLRRHLAARPARDRSRARRRAADREPLGLAVPRRQGGGARGDARHPRPRQRVYLAFCNLVGGQDELVFDGHSVVLDDEGEVIARAPGFEEALLVVDIDPTEAIGRRLRDVRRRELERSRERRPAATLIALGAPRSRRPGRCRTVVPFTPELEQMRLALGLGAARLRATRTASATSCSASRAGSTRR